MDRQNAIFSDIDRLSDVESAGLSGRQLVLGAGIAAVVLVVAAVSVLAGHRLRQSEVSDLRERVHALDGDLAAAQLALGGVQSEAVLLDGQIAELTAEEERLRALVQQQERDLGFRDAEIAGLQQTVSEAGLAKVAELRRELAVNEVELARVTEELAALELRLSSLTPIDTADLAVDPLLLDLSGGNVVYTRALCTGSMEPNITCDDLLVLYEPSSTTDLDVGDIIYFRKQDTGCTGALDDRFTLHRIIDVRSSSSGIFFQTKGDAFTFPDSCLVPATDVLYKLLTTVRDSRIVE